MENYLSSDLDLILEWTPGLWEGLRGKRLLITGGTGFIGCWMLESFLWANRRLELGAEAVVLTRSPAAFERSQPHLARAAGIRLWPGDVRDFSFPPGRFTAVLHLATPARARMISEQPLEMLDTILAGTRRALDFAREKGVESFLLASSGAVYGRQPAELSRLPESYLGGPDPLNPLSCYAEGKRAAEQLCAIYSARGEVPVRVARPFAFGGPYLPLDEHYAFGNFMRDALRGSAIVVNGDGSPLRSYLYAADLAAWLWTILLRGKAGAAYNVGSPEAVSIRELAERIAALSGSAVGVEVRGEPAGGRSPERYIPDVTRAGSELGLQPWTALDATILRTLAWHRQRGAR